jgi:hypothetical protein
MVRRTAFTELKRSWLRVFGTMIAMTLMFVAPPVLLAGGLALLLVDSTFLPLAVQGFAAWALLANLHRPAVRHFGLLDARALLLPVAGVLYALMTVDSALRGGRGDWR